jgi:hypothetical protein
LILIVLAKCEVLISLPRVLLLDENYLTKEVISAIKTRIRKYSLEEEMAENARFCRHLGKGSKLEGILSDNL